MASDSNIRGQLVRHCDDLGGIGGWVVGFGQSRPMAFFATETNFYFLVAFLISSISVASKTSYLLLRNLQKRPTTVEK